MIETIQELAIATGVNTGVIRNVMAEVIAPRFTFQAELERKLLVGTLQDRALTLSLIMRQGLNT